MTNANTFSKFILLFCFLHLSAAVLAQEFTGGIMAGLTACQIDGDSQSGYNKAGLYLGGYIQRKINDQFGGQLEIRYAQKGAYNKNTESKLAMHYLEVPLLMQYNRWNATFEAGVVPGVLISAKVISDANLEYDVDSYHRYAADIAAGASYPITVKLTAHARYAYSLFAIQSISNQYTTRSQYHNTLNFGFSYAIK